MVTEQPQMPRDERRRSPRYRLRDAQATMCWNETSKQMASTGSMLNISGGGAALLADQAPAVGSFVELQVGRAPSLLGPLEACVLACSIDPSSKLFVRLQFTHWVSIGPILEKHLEQRL